MKLLICTQKVDKNDDLLGFFHAWIAEFAQNCEGVTVVCLFRGEVDLPENVRVLSLGKESGDFRFSIFDFRFILKFKYLINFFKYIWQERKNYDTVFVHMNSIYVLLGGLFWKAWGKKIGLWYAHGHAPWQLLVAEKMVDVVFTSTASGCRLKSGKIRIVGQGIDVGNFRFPISDFRFREIQKSKIENPKSPVWTSGPLRDRKSKISLITVGRISPVKNLETLINAVELLVKKGIDVKLDIVGAIGLVEQKAYYDFLSKMINEKGLAKNIQFVGSVPNKDIVEYLQAADIFVSASQTGSLDKTFLEAMACGLPVIGCNVALDAVLGEYKDRLFYSAGDYLALSDKIENVLGLSEAEYAKMAEDLRGVVVREHGLGEFVKKILKISNTQ